MPRRYQVGINRGELLSRVSTAIADRTTVCLNLSDGDNEDREITFHVSDVSGLQSPMETIMGITLDGDLVNVNISEDAITVVLPN